MKKQMRFTFCVISVICSIGLVHAIPVTNSCEGTFIDFEIIGPGELITTQYLGLGVTFSGGLYGDPFPDTTIKGTMEATNYPSSSPINNPITAAFSQTQYKVGFQVGGTTDGDNTILLRAYSGLNMVDESTFMTGTLSLPGGNIPSVFAFLQVPQGFDRIEISRLDGNEAFGIDDFCFVPEPASMLLLGLGGLVLRKRRNI